MARKAGSSKGGGLTAEMPIAVVFGDEPFLLAQHTRQLHAALVEKHGDPKAKRPELTVPQIVFDGMTATLAAVLDELRSYGLMERHKLVIVDPIDKFLLDPSDEEGAPPPPPGTITKREALERYAENPVENATLLLRGPTWRKSKLDKLIEAAGGVLIKVEGLKEHDAIAWCVERAAEAHKSAIEMKAAELLVYRIGAHLVRLDLELAKLADAAEPGKAIDLKLVKAMTPMSREEEAWVIQEPVVKGVAQPMLEKLDELMLVATRESNVAIPVSWAINDVLRKVYMASTMLRQGMKEFAVTKELRLWGPSTQPIMSQAKRNEPAAIAQLMRLAMRVDSDNKSGRGDPRRNLETLCVRVADTFAPRGAVQRDR